MGNRTGEVPNGQVRKLGAKRQAEPLRRTVEQAQLRYSEEETEGPWSGDTQMTPEGTPARPAGQVTSSRGGQERELAFRNATGQRAKLGLRLGGSDPVGCQEMGTQACQGGSVRRQLTRELVRTKQTSQGLRLG